MAYTPVLSQAAANVLEAKLRQPTPIQQITQAVLVGTQILSSLVDISQAKLNSDKLRLEIQREKDTQKALDDLKKGWDKLSGILDGLKNFFNPIIDDNLNR